MFTDRISDYFDGVAAKYLSAVDAEPEKSNQHEIGGLPSAGFKKWLGTPSKDEKSYFPARQVYISDADEETLVHDGQVSWYDCRYNQPKRSPEYRLYYESTPVTSRIRKGDFFLIAKHRNGSLLMVFTPAGGAVERQLRAVFGLKNVLDEFSAGQLNTDSLLLPIRLLLEEIGIDLNKPESDEGMWLDKLVDKFGGLAFPSTSEFSAYARSSLGKSTDAVAKPDEALMNWMEQEEKLFRIYERHLVKERLADGFGKDGSDVDGFINFSLSVQNRRKSRVGYAFEDHLSKVFEMQKLTFEQGRKNRFTENNKRPDFLFPSFDAYHNPEFPVAGLLMLGAKTTCKDRWRQVLSEADRIQSKHLITLEASISEAQTDEMLAKQLQLVVPATIHKTFTANQQESLLDVQEFIELVKVAQQTAP